MGLERWLDEERPDGPPAALARPTFVRRALVGDLDDAPIMLDDRAIGAISITCSPPKTDVQQYASAVKAAANRRVNVTC